MIESTPRIRQAKIIWLIIGIANLFVWSIPFWTTYTGKGNGTEFAESILRDYTQFKWYVIPLLLIVLNAYADELRNKNYSVFFGGLALFFMDAFSEIWNGLFHTATGGYAAVWQCIYPTAYEPLIGWNIEIIFMFLLMGLAAAKVLPADKEKMMFGGKINNRHVLALIMAVASVIVEITLNRIGGLQWNYWWWQPSFPWLLLITCYLAYFEVCFLVHDLPDTRKQAIFVGAMASVVLICLAVFIPLGWI